MLATFTNRTIYDVRRDLAPLPKLPHILYSHLISSATVSSCHCIILPLYHHATVSSWHCIIMPLYHPDTVSSCHCIILPLYHHATVSSWHCINLPLYHHATVSPWTTWWWPTYRAETCSCILYIATNCNIVVFMSVCIYRYIHTTALCYWPNTTGMTHFKMKWIQRIFSLKQTTWYFVKMFTPLRRLLDTDTIQPSSVFHLPFKI